MDFELSRSQKEIKKAAKDFAKGYKQINHKKGVCYV